MYYLEYRLPYDFGGSSANLRHTEDGRVYREEFRPILPRKDSENGLFGIFSLILQTTGQIEVKKFL